jgi:hypothetical protein
MKKLVLLVCGFVAACNYDTGECYLRGEEGAGAGGGAIIPTGYGGFGDVPPKPQGGPAPVDPCQQKAECTVTWKADSDVCKNQGTTGTCTSYYQGNHLTLSEAQTECARVSGPGAESCGSCHWVTNATGDPVEKCKKVCDQQYETCVKPCKTQDCYAACMDVYKECLRECGK